MAERATVMRPEPLTKAGVVAFLTLVATAGHGFAATTGDGTVLADVGQLVEITVTDNSIASYTEFAPTSGAETVKYSNSDFLRFSNAKSNIQSLWTYSAGVSFVQDSTGSTVTTTVDYQGATTTLSDLVYLAQSSSGAYYPWQLATTADHTPLSWTKHASCDTVSVEGEWSIASYSNAGAAQAAITRYYQVCDSTELYLSDSTNFASADLAYKTTATAAGASATAGNYEVTINGVDYVFHSVSGSTVTIRQGQFAALGSSSQTADVHVLMKFPDGFPAGQFTATVTATAADIVT